MTCIHIVTLSAGEGLQSLNEERIKKVARCSDELTRCNARHGTATTDSNTANLTHISQGAKTNNALFICGF